MSSLLYFVSLPAILILAILFQEYRKLAGTKAVLSRLATKNGWNIRFGDTFRKQHADFPG